MERYTMFLDWKNQHCENDYITQSNLQIQCNPYQITNGIFHRTRTKNFTICMETQKSPNSQSNLEIENTFLLKTQQQKQTKTKTSMCEYILYVRL